jgi:hypothetical protein
MTTPHGRTHRSPQKHRLAYLILVVAAVLLAFLAVPHLRKHLSRPESADAGERGIAPNPLSSIVPHYRALLDSRVLFPYSVIPGGVESARELKNAIANDPVVARHYAGFDVADARVVPLARTRSVYVSYRIGDQVFWTRRTLTLLKGELVITDGTHEARTRCGNRISASAQEPTSSREPPSAAFEAIRNPELFSVEQPPVGSSLTAPPVAMSIPAVSNFSETGEEFVAPLAPPYWPPFWGPLPIIPIGPPLHPHPPHPPHHPVPPPVSVPEPGTGSLLALGLLACLLLAEWRRVA